MKKVGYIDVAAEVELHVEDAFNEGATAMRDKCLERVKHLRNEWESLRNRMKPLSKMRNRYDAAFCAANEILTNLESLTLDEVEQEKQTNAYSTPQCGHTTFPTTTTC